uniref:ATP synthase F0 subunit 8 n=1 Tax=Viviparus viviparus TaxID=54978 RepID=A0A7D7AD98_9CAEN|nr:ATP synthase F0 subunit 8 [Viviparus viviparus]
MPQLSPLNWILLFLFFWVMVSLMSVLIWWMSKVNFGVIISADDTVVVDMCCFENKWEW